MSENKSALQILSEPFESSYGRNVDLKNQSYREAHKALIKVAEKTVDAEITRQTNSLSNRVKLSLVAVLGAVVTITACVAILAYANMHNNDNSTRVEISKIQQK